MAIRGSELCFGLVMLLEAAQFYGMSTPTPPRASKKRGAASLMSPSLPPSGPIKPIHCCKPVSYHHLPPKKRVKLDFAEASGGVDRRSPCKPINFRPVKKASKCTKGSAHRVWEQTGASPAAAASASRFSSLAALDTIVPQKHTATTTSNESNTFVLYEKDDDDHINALHNVVRRDIWEGFVVNAFSEGENDATHDTSARRSGRLARYEGTVGFRCRFCKHAPYLQRAEKSAVYPRSLKRIYLANIRFQRDHVEHCMHIPSELKDEYWRLKESKNLSRGRKQYWVTSAQRRGLCNGANGIVFQAGSN
ncbi:hypothetical protein ACHAXT_012554 [Thalassiosira profunda]